jgi:excisionase family DNA binding protein
MPFRLVGSVFASPAEEYAVPNVIVFDSAPPLPDRALDIFEVAAVLNVSTKTIRRRIAAGELPATKVGQRWRIWPGDVRMFMGGDAR